MAEEQNIPKEIADTLTNTNLRDKAKEMLERLSTENEPVTARTKIACGHCGQKVIFIENKVERCTNCGFSLTQLAISTIQNDKRRSESLITDPKTKKQTKILETPKIINESAVVPKIPVEIKNFLMEKREFQRRLLKQKNVREVTPNETRTQILRDLQNACGSWEKLFAIYIDQGMPVFRTEFLSETYAVREFKNYKYKVIITAIKDLMDTLIQLGEIPEEYFMNYNEYYQKAMESEDENGIIPANRVVAFASYYVQSPRSSVVTKRIARSLG